MKIFIVFISVFLLPGLLFSQERKREFIINNTGFVIIADSIRNEWDTYDHINKLHRKENDMLVYLLTYYTFKDEGGDCDNLFRIKETMEVKNDSLIFLTHYWQLTGRDPIPEWRKQIYMVNKKGRLNLVYDKQKYYHQEQWVQSE